VARCWSATSATSTSAGTVRWPRCCAPMSVTTTPRPVDRQLAVEAAEPRRLSRRVPRRRPRAHLGAAAVSPAHGPDGALTRASGDDPALLDELPRHRSAGAPSPPSRATEAHHVTGRLQRGRLGGRPLSLAAARRCGLLTDWLARLGVICVLGEIYGGSGRHHVRVSITVSDGDVAQVAKPLSGWARPTPVTAPSGQRRAPLPAPCGFAGPMFEGTGSTDISGRKRKR
jgi:hypothetical protein